MLICSRLRRYPCGLRCGLAEVWNGDGPTQRLNRSSNVVHDAPEGFYPSYPDVMQVADDRNPAIHTLRGEAGYPGNEFISETEYGHMSYSYPQGNNNPNGDTPQQSLFWGVRWLYNKAQAFGPKNLTPPYFREWETWKGAVYKYNGEGDRYYQDKVYSLFEKGIDPQGNHLW